MSIEDFFSGVNKVIITMDKVVADGNFSAYLWNNFFSILVFLVVAFMATAIVINFFAVPLFNILIKRPLKWIFGKKGSISSSNLSRDSRIRYRRR